VFYATRDGQSRCIARRIVDRLAADSIGATAHDLALVLPVPVRLECASLAILVAAVRYGRHLPEATRFLSWYGALCAPPPLALASVNLTARKPGRSTADGNPYLRKLIARSGVRPVLATAFAGRLDYPRYRWFDREIIRCIM
jgi:menaquinone-dependent protoporphyrinogen oxidase